MESLLALQQVELRRHVIGTLTVKKVPSLKRMCKERGLRVGGKKADVLDRLVDDVLNRGWTVPTDHDLWKNFDQIPESPVHSEKKVSRLPAMGGVSGSSSSDAPSSSDAACSSQDEAVATSSCSESVTLCDSDSGRSSSPSSSSSSLRSSPTHPASIHSSPSFITPSSSPIARKDGGRKRTVGHLSPSVSGSDSEGRRRRKRVALFVDTESPTAKRKKNISGQSTDSGVVVTRRPHLTRRMLKADLRASSTKTGTDLLSENNVDLILDTIKDYAVAESESSCLPQETPRIAATSFKTFLSPFLESVKGQGKVDSDPSCVCAIADGDDFIDGPCIDLVGAAADVASAVEAAQDQRWTSAASYTADVYCFPDDDDSDQGYDCAGLPPSRFDAYPVAPPATSAWIVASTSSTPASVVATLTDAGLPVAIVTTTPTATNPLSTTSSTIARLSSDENGNGQKAADVGTVGPAGATDVTGYNDLVVVNATPDIDWIDVSDDSPTLFSSSEGEEFDIPSYDEEPVYELL